MKFKQPRATNIRGTTTAHAVSFAGRSKHVDINSPFYAQALREGGAGVRANAGLLVHDSTRGKNSIENQTDRG